MSVRQRVRAGSGTLTSAILAAPPPAPSLALWQPVRHRPKSIPERIVVLGWAGSAKTTSPARPLAARLGPRHLERDALGDDEASGFATQVAAAIDAAGSRWVFDGAPSNAELAVDPQADTVVALDDPRWLVQRRVLTRSVRRWLTHRGDGPTPPPRHQAAAWLVSLSP